MLFRCQADDTPGPYAYELPTRRAPAASIVGRPRSPRGGTAAEVTPGPETALMRDTRSTKGAVCGVTVYAPNCALQ
eukprot:m.738990 g.738990  ORF g.738990 m.738990 type:complete len:76 (+) comp23101_c0_seq16:120-347(+)